MHVAIARFARHGASKHEFRRDIEVAVLHSEGATPRPSAYAPARHGTYVTSRTLNKTEHTQNRSRSTQIVACPGEMVSDSFYFVDNKLVMHNKADYTYHHADPSVLKGPGFEGKFDEKTQDEGKSAAGGRGGKK